MNPNMPLSVPAKTQEKRKTYAQIESISTTTKVILPKTVVILGSGPNGRAAWPLIPADAYVIALNEAVNAYIDHPGECAFIPAIWIVNDHGVLETPYWNRANRNFHGIRVFGDRTLEIIRQKYMYTQQQAHALQTGNVFSIPRGPFHKAEQGNWTHDLKVFKPGGSVCAAALWVVCIKDVKRVYLCGIDMSGDIHYSNTVEPERPDPRHGKEWGTSRPALDERIRYFKTTGMEIYTLSETKLKNVEMAEYHA